MERLTKAKIDIKNLYEIEFEKREKNGGQSCGMYIPCCIVRSDELEIEIKVKSFRSNYKNRELAILLMDLAMDEIVK